jgi:CRP-like cAMP-binding protein
MCIKAQNERIGKRVLERSRERTRRDMIKSDCNVFDGIPSWVKRYKPGQTVFAEGGPSNLMFRVESGCVRLQVNGSEGVRQIISFVFSREFFGCSAEEQSFSAEAVSTTILRCWSVRAILYSGGRSADMPIALINFANAQVAEMAHHLEKVSHLTATARVRWFLSRMQNREDMSGGDGRLDLPMTRRDIADYLSLSAETLSRAIHELEEDGFLQREGRRSLWLHDQQLQPGSAEVQQLFQGSPDNS